MPFSETLLPHPAEASDAASLPDEAARAAAAAPWISGAAAALLLRYRAAPLRGGDAPAPAAGLDADVLASALPPAAHAALRTALSSHGAFDPELGALVAKDFRDRDRRLLGAAVREAKSRAAEGASVAAGAKRQRPAVDDSDADGAREESLYPPTADASAKPPATDELVGLWMGWWEWGVPADGREYACRAGAAIDAAASGAEPNGALPASFFIADVPAGALLPPQRIEAAAQRWAAIEAAAVSRPGRSKMAGAGSGAGPGAASADLAAPAVSASASTAADPPTKARKTAELAKLGAPPAVLAKRRAEPPPPPPAKGVSARGARTAPVEPRGTPAAFPQPVPADGWALARPSAAGRWVVGWVARVDASSSRALVVFDWPAAVGATLSPAALAAAGIATARSPLAYSAWVDLAAVRALPLLRPSPLIGLRPSAVALASLSADAAAALVAAAPAGAPRCTFCLHLARAESPLLPCGGGDVPACGRFSHAACVAPSFASAAAAGVYQCDACAHACCMCGTRHARGSVVDSALLNEAIDRRDAAKKDVERARRGLPVATVAPAAGSPRAADGAAADAAADPLRPAPSPFRRDRMLGCTWESATMDERGADAADAVWTAYKYVPIAGDNVFTARMRALRGESVPSCASIAAAADRRAVERVVGRGSGRARGSGSGSCGDGHGGVCADSSVGAGAGAGAGAAAVGGGAFLDDSVAAAISTITSVAALSAPSSLSDPAAAALAAAERVVDFFSGEDAIAGEVDFDYDGPLRWRLCGLPVMSATPVAPAEPVDLRLCAACATRMSSGAFCPCCHGGYAEDSGVMLACDACAGWVHAHCDELTREDLSAIEAGAHPAWGAAYVCAVCRRAGAAAVLAAVTAEDKAGFFASPVTEDVAPGYFNVISNPMDTATIGARLTAGDYDARGVAGLAAFRADLELVVRNALVFNTPQDRVYREAWRILRVAAAAFARLLPMTPDSPHRADFERLRALIKDPKILADCTLPPRVVLPSARSGGSGGGGAGAAPGTSLGAAARASVPSPVDAALEDDSVAAPAAPLEVPPPVIAATSASSDDAIAWAAAAVAAAEAYTARDALAELMPARNAMLFGASTLGPRVAIEHTLLPFRPTRGQAAAARSAFAVGLAGAAAAAGAARDVCATCGASGDAHFLLFCRDCGEAHHAFCAAPALFASLLGASAAAASGLASVGAAVAAAGAPGVVAPSATSAALGSATLRAALKRLAAGSAGFSARASGGSSSAFGVVAAGGGSVGAGAGLGVGVTADAAPTLSHAGAAALTLISTGAAGWQCSACRVCTVCGECTDEHEDRLLSCDTCDAGVHTFCASPPLRDVPDGAWHCGACVACQACGTGAPGGALHAPGAWSVDPAACLRCKPATDDRGAPVRSVSAAAGAVTSAAVGPPEDVCPICLQRVDEEDGADVEPPAGLRAASAAACAGSVADVFAAPPSSVGCDSCPRWTHVACEPLALPRELWTALAAFDPDVTYHCAVCRKTGGGGRGSFGRAREHAQARALAAHAERVRAAIRCAAAPARLAASTAAAGRALAGGDGDAASNDATTSAVALADEGHALAVGSERGRVDAALGWPADSLSLVPQAGMPTNVLARARRFVIAARYSSPAKRALTQTPEPLGAEPVSLERLISRDAVALAGATARAAGAAALFFALGATPSRPELAALARSLILLPPSTAHAIASRAIAHQRADARAIASAPASNAVPGTDAAPHGRVPGAFLTSTAAAGDIIDAAPASEPVALSSDGYVAADVVAPKRARSPAYDAPAAPAAAPPSHTKRRRHTGGWALVAFDEVTGRALEGGADALWEVAYGATAPAWATGARLPPLPRDAAPADAPTAADAAAELVTSTAGGDRASDVAGAGTCTPYDLRSCALCAQSGDLDFGVMRLAEAAAVGGRRGMAIRGRADAALLDADAPTGTADAPTLGSGVEGRLLPLPPPASGAPATPWTFVHVLCALWSSDTFEGGVGGCSIHGVASAVRRAATARCAECAGFGASVACSRSGCSRTFHLRCLLASGGVLQDNKATFCAAHRTPVMSAAGAGTGAGAGAGTGSGEAAADDLPLALGPRPFPTMQDVFAAYIASPIAFAPLSHLSQACPLRVSREGEAGATPRDAARAAARAALHDVDFSSGLAEEARGPPLLEELAAECSSSPADVAAAAAALAAGDEPLLLDMTGGAVLRTAAFSPLSALLERHPALASPDVPPEGAVLRVGALTVLRWGRLVTRRPGYAAPPPSPALFPVGFRSRRVWWVPSLWRGAAHAAPVLARGTYTCDILDGGGPPLDSASARAAAALPALATGATPSEAAALLAAAAAHGPTFVITCDAWPELRVAARSADSALAALRSALVDLCGATAVHLLSREERAQLAARAAAVLGGGGSAVAGVRSAVARALDARAGGRLRWGGASAPALTGASFFGVSLAPVAAALESLPDAALMMVTPAGSSAWWPRYAFVRRTLTLAAVAEAREKRIVAAGGAAATAADDAAAAAVAAAKAAASATATEGEGTGAAPPTPPPHVALVDAPAARVYTFDRADRACGHHHASSMLAARAANLHAVVLESVDRAAMGDAPLALALIDTDEVDSGADGGGAGADARGAAVEARTTRGAEARERDADGKGGAGAMVGGGAGVDGGSGGQGGAAGAGTALTDIIARETSAAGAGAGAGAGAVGAGGDGDEDESGAVIREGEYTTTDTAASALYKSMRSWIISEHICVRRSPIHGWGLFLKADVLRDAVLIEYAGEIVRQPTADRREVAYEEAARVTGRINHAEGAAAGGAAVLAVATAGGEAAERGDFDLVSMFQVPGLSGHSDGSGSCYLFRLDDERIVDATLAGCAARFINHCCEPNCYSRVITYEGEKRIGICALRPLRKGEELTYNYKFAIETDPDRKIPCYCGAPSCWGTMN